MAPHKIIFGSMRMLEYDFGQSHWVNLFKSMTDLGVQLFHSSSEYESFPIFCETLSEFKFQHPEVEVGHIVKLAEPHFHINDFSADRLEQKVDEYLEKLHVKSLYSIQWMWRGDMSDNDSRLANFDNAVPEINKAIADLKAKGKIEHFHCFPYDVDFGNIALEQLDLDGLIVYRNALEHESDELLQKAASLGKNSFIIRPLFAKKVFEHSNESAKSLITSALDFPGVDGAVLSISSLEKLKQIL